MPTQNTISKQWAQPVPNILSISFEWAQHKLLIRFYKSARKLSNVICKMNEIRQIRQSLGISQRELANLLSIPKSLISMAESRQRALPDEVLTYLRFIAANTMPVREIHPAIEEEMQRRRGVLETQLRNDYLEKIKRIEVQISTLDKELVIRQTFTDQIQAKLFLLGEELAATLKGSRQYGIIFSEINRLLDMHYKPNQVYHQFLTIKRDSLRMELEGYRAVLGS